MSTVNTIFETNDYSKFKFGKFNRGIDPKNLEQKKKSISEFGLLDPITVQKEGSVYRIYDGMHRFVACCELKVNLICRITVGETRETVIARNKDVKVWNNLAYIDSYANAGNKNYLLINEFRSLYKEFGSEAFSNILSQNANTGGSKNLKNGKFVVDDFQYSCEFADKLTKLKPYTKVYIKNRFIVAFKSVLIKNPTFDMDWFIKNLSKPKYQYVFDGIDSIQIFKEKIIDVYNNNARNISRIN